MLSSIPAGHFLFPFQLCAGVGKQEVTGSNLAWRYGTLL